MSHAISYGARPSFFRSQAPAARNTKRPNGHKVQLALKREIEGLTDQLDREKRAVAAARNAADALEDQLFRAEADRDRWRRRSGEHEKFVEKMEALLGLPSAGRSWEEREAQLIDAISHLRSQE